jgi:hypothetical protein
MKHLTRPERVLGKRALNRALLERQLLLRRAKLSTYDAIAHLAGIQSQAPNSAYYALWTRLANFQPDDLAQLIIGRSVVRIALMRSTIHLVTDQDSLAFRPLLQSMHDRGFKSNFGSRLEGVDIEALTARGRTLVEEVPRTFSELGHLLGAQWSGRDSEALSGAIRTYVPLVQVPPRGIWGASGKVSHTSLESWLGKPLNLDYSSDEMLLRYLAAFGPASIKDIQVWSGLTRMNVVIERLRPQLRTFHDEQGKLLFDLIDAPLPDPDTIAPPRFLAEFDNMLLSYEDRTRILSEINRKRLFTLNGLIRAVLLVDGFVCGTWKIERQHNNATLIIELYEPLSKKDILAVTEEGMLLLKFAVAEESTHHIQFITSP